MKNKNIIDELILEYRSTKKSQIFNKLKSIFDRSLEIHTKMAYQKYYKFINYNEILLLTEMCFYKLINDYDFNKGATFKTYVGNYLKYRLNDEIKMMLPPKKDAMRNYCNIEKTHYQEDKKQYTFREFNMEEYINDVSLSEIEKQVFKMHFEGETLNSISKILKRNYKSVDNALQRAKKKLKKSIIFK